MDPGAIDSLHKFRSQSCRPQAPDHLATFVPGEIKYEDIGHRNDLTLHTGDFGDIHNLTGTIAHTRFVDHQLDG